MKLTGRKYQMKYRDAVASLVVRDVVDRDVGTYTMEASNKSGFASSSAALRLKAAPRLEIDDRYKDMTAYIGQSVRLGVSMEGEPAPTAKWTKDGSPLDGVRDTYIDTTDYQSTLCIRRCNISHSGEYECVAKNEWGSAKLSMRIRVMGRLTVII